MTEARMTLRDRRYCVRKTGKEVASEAKINPSVYSLMERGVRKLSIENAYKLSKVFGVSWHLLIEENYPEIFEEDQNDGKLQ